MLSAIESEQRDAEVSKVSKVAKVFNKAVSVSNSVVSVVMLLIFLGSENSISESTKIQTLAFLSFGKSLLQSTKAEYWLTKISWLLTAAFTLVALEDWGVVSLSFLPQSIPKLSKVVVLILLSAFGLALKQVIMLRRDMRELRQASGEVYQIGTKVNYIEKRLMTMMFFSTHEVIRQLSNLIQCYDPRLDETFRYVNRQAQAILSRAVMGWKSGCVSEDHCAKLQRLVILEAKTQAVWVSEHEYGHEGCFPGAYDYETVVDRVENFMNQGLLQTFFQGTVEQAKTALRREIELIDDFPKILLPAQ